MADTKVTDEVEVTVSDGTEEIYVNDGLVDGKMLISTISTKVRADATKADVGLSNVDNTSDANKPISTATQTALDGKEPTITKNTGFNKNFGTSAGTVSEGNHLHSGVYEPAFSKNTGFNLVLGTGSGQVAEGNHLHTGVYEPVFSKNTGFNLNLGTTAGTVAEGNHTHTDFLSSEDTLTAATGNNFVAGEVGYVTSTGVVKAQGNTEANVSRRMVMATATINAGASGVFLLEGPITLSSLTEGAYSISPSTAGAIYNGTFTTGQFKRIIGYAESATNFYFKPDGVWVEKS